MPKFFGREQSGEQGVDIYLAISNFIATFGKY